MIELIRKVEIDIIYLIYRYLIEILIVYFKTNFFVKSFYLFKYT
jgi:hypothetical protein